MLCLRSLLVLGLWATAWGLPRKPPGPSDDDGQTSPVSSLQLDSVGNFNLFWQVDHSAKMVTFELKLQLHPSSWFAFGFSDRGNLSGADFCILWVDRKGDHHFEDGHTNSEGFLYVEEQQHCRLDSLKRKGSSLRFLFSRSFDTCDDKDYKIEQGTVHVVFASGPGPLKRADGLRITRAVHKGFQRTTILKPTVGDEEEPLPEDVKTYAFLNDQVAVPKRETTYWCKMFRFPPEFRRKQHIVQYEAVISPDSEGVVHHMELFHCEVDVREVLPDWNDDCYSPQRPQILGKCKHVVAAWAMGAPPLRYPKVAGLPTGGRNYSSFVMLEVHFNNPELRSDIIDSSGVQIHYTDRLRQHDIGILEVGLEYTDKMAVPPGQPKFDLKGYCISECTRAGLPPNGINIVAAQLHTHLAGVAVWVEHSRGGASLGEIARDNHFSTHFQEIRRLPREVNVLPGDAVTITCRYNTVDRKDITLGGFGIHEEMCVTYMHYYPLSKLEVCKSSIDSFSLRSFFDYMNTAHHEKTSRRYGISDNYKSIEWSPYNTELLKEFYAQMPLSMQCNRSDGDRFPGNWEGMPTTNILYPLREEDTSPSCSDREQELELDRK
ncbi:dopamine beta-hydroxylase [Galendromus occidentalis]|uniref:Dopamine beta-hydroxylase n=1 Tax=Galendromus occidentalis TaxID=34638 RepID=A0AAJ6QTM8_9ACAR|nr:dopamine beta-hydroxylase [Galendromus occidentalis]